MAPTPGLSVTILVAVPVQGKQTASVGWCRDPRPSAGEDPRRRVWPGRESCKQEGGGRGQRKGGRSPAEPPEPRLPLRQSHCESQGFAAQAS